MDEDTYKKTSKEKNEAKIKVLAIMDEFCESKAFGGFEVKYEAGKVTFVKDWRGRKY